ncbi:hypothetical protein TorRG33x02_346800 [Trema orientale]|uniref:Uncharacterized protein n=1 Tax=Trema orientale TaxID=63057 RepID=A0A2P5AMD8_TREOI|nr:hypothetical protein TorRG33x02_346800 [Trema orientale]
MPTCSLSQLSSRFTPPPWWWTPLLPLIGQQFSGDSFSITSDSNYMVKSSLHRSSHGLIQIAVRIGSSSSSSSASASSLSTH